MVYEKTPKGQQEVANNQRVLNPKQRQVLIMIDGKRTLDELTRYFNAMNLPEMIHELESLGYIYDPTAKIPADTPIQAATSKSQEVAIDPERLAAIKQVLLAATAEFLGIMGRGMVAKIEGAQSHEQIKSCISQWHMAMRESKTGREVAGGLMQNVQAMLNPAAETESGG